MSKQADARLQPNSKNKWYNSMKTGNPEQRFITFAYLSICSIEKSSVIVRVQNKDAALFSRAFATFQGDLRQMHWIHELSQPSSSGIGTTSVSKTLNTGWATAPRRCCSMSTPTGYPAAREKSPCGLIPLFRPHRTIMKRHLIRELENAVSAALLYGCCKTAIKTKKRLYENIVKPLKYLW